MIRSWRTILPYLMVSAVVFATAAWFRFWKASELLILTPDQGRALLAGRAILQGQWLWEGPATSVSGVTLGPLYYYLTAAALWFSRFHPLGPALMTAGFGVLTAVLLAVFVTRFWDARTGLLAGLLYALSPLTVLQSRIALEPSPLPFFVVLFLWSTAEWLTHRKLKMLALAAVIPLFAIQLNFSAIILWPMLIGASILRFDPPSWSTWRWFLPLLIGGWMGILVGKWIWSTLSTFEYLWRMWLQLTIPRVPFASAVLLGLALWQVFWWFVATFLWIKHERRVDPLVLLFSCWIGLSAVAFSLKTVAGDHALGLLFPLPALTLAVVLRPLQRAFRTQTFLVVLLPIMLLLSGQTTLALLNHDQQKLTDHLPVVQTIAALTQKEPYALVYRGHLDIYAAADDHYQYLLWLNGTPPVVAGLRNLQPENREPWLPTTDVVPQRTLYLYSSEDRRREYGGNGGEVVPVGPIVLELVQNTDMRYNAASPAVLPPSWP